MNSKWKLVGETKKSFSDKSERCALKKKLISVSLFVPTARGHIFVTGLLRAQHLSNHGNEFDLHENEHVGENIMI